MSRVYSHTHKPNSIPCVYLKLVGPPQKKSRCIWKCYKIRFRILDVFPAVLLILGKSFKVLKVCDIVLKVHFSQEGSRMQRMSRDFPKAQTQVRHVICQSSRGYMDPLATADRVSQISERVIIILKLQKLVNLTMNYFKYVYNHVLILYLHINVLFRLKIHSFCQNEWTYCYKQQYTNVACNRKSAFVINILTCQFLDMPRVIAATRTIREFPNGKNKTSKWRRYIDLANSANLSNLLWHAECFWT